MAVFWATGMRGAGSLPMSGEQPKAYSMRWDLPSLSKSNSPLAIDPAARLLASSISEAQVEKERATAPLTVVRVAVTELTNPAALLTRTQYLPELGRLGVV